MAELPDNPAIMLLRQIADDGPSQRMRERALALGLAPLLALATRFETIMIRVTPTL